VASIVLEILDHQGIDIPIEIIPGITAAQATASRLGSPLSGDFVVVSLSDRLTPWDVIENRLELAFSMGVPVVLYNPRSKGRPAHLTKALSIALEHLPADTPVGVVKNAYRLNEEVLVMTLQPGGTGRWSLLICIPRLSLAERRRGSGRMGSDVKGIITPRGYHRKYTY
jgi:precorrin-3B C17-methyltransferase